MAYNQSHYTSYVYGMAFSYISSVLYNSISYVSGMGCIHPTKITLAQLCQYHWIQDHCHCNCETILKLEWTQTHCYVSTMHGMESQRSSSQDTLTLLLAYHWQSIPSQKDGTGYIHTVMLARLIIQFALGSAAQYTSARCQVGNCCTSYVHRQLALTQGPVTIYHGSIQHVSYMRGYYHSHSKEQLQ